MSKINEKKETLYEEIKNEEEGRRNKAEENCEIEKSKEKEVDDNGSIDNYTGNDIQSPVNDKLKHSVPGKSNLQDNFRNSTNLDLNETNQNTTHIKDFNGVGGPSTSLSQDNTTSEEDKNILPNSTSLQTNTQTSTSSEEEPFRNLSLHEPKFKKIDQATSISNLELRPPPEPERKPAQQVPYSEQPILPKRHVLLLMLFLGFAVIYSLRVNVNVAIVAMVNNRTKITKSGNIIIHAAEFKWDSHTQALVIGSFYYGYWVLQVPGAWIAMRLGATRVFGYGVLLASLMSLITPVATRYDVMAMVGVRLVQGLFLGVTFPCVIAIWAKWAPPLERSTMVTMAIAGSPVGNIIAIPVTGLLAKYGFDGGWPSVFYFFGLLGLLWYLVWEFVVYDSPQNHPSITIKERTFIEKTIHEKAFDPLTETPPWKAIFTSIPMWGIIIGHFGACWGYYTLFTQMPTYLKDIQHLDIKTMGLVAATPYILKAFLGPIGGISADMLLRHGILSVRGVRTMFYGLGCLLAAFFILMTGYYVRKGEAIAFLILGVGFSGLNATGYAVNHLDLAPRYAGILMGISNTFATIPGFLSPMVTGFIAKNKKASEWKKVFWITFIVYVAATGLYTVMCSGERQWWAEGIPDQQDSIEQQQGLGSTLSEEEKEEEKGEEEKEDSKTK